jgi:hypothetical protein
MLKPALTWAGLLLGLAGFALQFTAGAPAGLLTFLDAVRLGYGHVASNALYMMAVLALLVIAADKFLARSFRTVPQ